MKLYTEEVLRNSMNSVKYYMEHYDASVIDKIIENHIKALAPIELPSEDKIEEYIKTFPYTKHLDDGQYNDGVIDGIELGINWYREQLKNK